MNIFNLAKNSGTSVNQIERSYACHLPLSRRWPRTYRALVRVSGPGLIRDLNASLSQQVFNIRKAKMNSEIQPDGLLDHIDREAMTTIGKIAHRTLVAHGIGWPDALV